MALAVSQETTLAVPVCPGSPRGLLSQGAHPHNLPRVPRVPTRLVASAHGLPRLEENGCHPQALALPNLWPGCPRDSHAI